MKGFMATLGDKGPIVLIDLVGSQALIQCRSTYGNPVVVGQGVVKSDQSHPSPKAKAVLEGIREDAERLLEKIDVSQVDRDDPGSIAKLFSGAFDAMSGHYSTESVSYVDTKGGQAYLDFTAKMALAVKVDIDISFLLLLSGQLDGQEKIELIEDLADSDEAFDELRKRYQELCERLGATGYQNPLELEILMDRLEKSIGSQEERAYFEELLTVMKQIGVW